MDNHFIISHEGKPEGLQGSGWTANRTLERRLVARMSKLVAKRMSKARRT
jgi:hypothetical protein